MRILVIEDESIIARRVMRMVRSHYGATLTSLEHFDDIDDGKDYLNSNEIDLLLLDLNLNGEDGFKVLKEVVAAPFHTIIISAHKEKAILAFEYGVLDFVPKPFNEERMYKAFSRYNQQVQIVNQGVKYLAIQKRGSQYLIAVDYISHIKGARIYTEIFLVDGSKEIHTKSLDKLSHLLPVSFERIHKSYIVDMGKVASMLAESGGKYTLRLKDGATLPVSRSRYKDLKEKWFK